MRHVSDAQDALVTCKTQNNNDVDNNNKDKEIGNRYGDVVSKNNVWILRKYKTRKRGLNELQTHHAHLIKYGTIINKGICSSILDGEVEERNIKLYSRFDSRIMNSFYAKCIRNTFICTQSTVVCLQWLESKLLRYETSVRLLLTKSFYFIKNVQPGPIVRPTDHFKLATKHLRVWMRMAHPLFCDRPSF